MDNDDGNEKTLLTKTDKSSIYEKTADGAQVISETFSKEAQEVEETTKSSFFGGFFGGGGTQKKEESGQIEEKPQEPPAIPKKPVASALQYNQPP